MYLRVHYSFNTAVGSGKKYTAKRPSTSMRASVVSINSAAETLTSGTA